MTTTTNATTTTIIRDEPALLQFGVRAGAPTEKIRALVVLNDDTGDVAAIFGCADCDYTSANYGSVFAHRRKHSTKPRAAKNVEAPKPDPAVALADVLMDAMRDNVREAVQIAYAQGLNASTAAADDLLTERAEMQSEIRSLRRRLGTLKRALLAG